MRWLLLGAVRSMDFKEQGWKYLGGSHRSPGWAGDGGVDGLGQLLREVLTALADGFVAEMR